MLTYGGYYDDAIEWVGLEGIQIVASMSGVGNPGRHPLSPRFTSIVRICHIKSPNPLPSLPLAPLRDVWSAPPAAELTSIYSAYLLPILDAKFQGHSSVWAR